jgi:hypothetical protein
VEDIRALVLTGLAPAAVLQAWDATARLELMCACLVAWRLAVFNKCYRRGDCWVPWAMAWWRGVPAAPCGITTAG